MKNARYLLNHQSFCDSVRRCAPVVFVSPGNNNFFCFFCAEHGIGHLVSARQTGNRVAYSSRCKLRSRVHSLCVRQMVYLPPVDMQCDSIFHMARGERWRKKREKPAETGGMKIWIWKKCQRIPYGLPPPPPSPQRLYQKLYSTRWTMRTRWMCSVQCASTARCCVRRVVVYQWDQTKV